MKKLLCILFLLLVVSVPACAQSSYDPAIMDTVITLVGTMFEESDYKEVIYDEHLNSICIKNGTDGFADTVQAMIALDNDAAHKSWTEYKDITLSFYNSILNFFQVAGLDDLGLVLTIVNDNVYLDKDSKGMPSPILLTLMNGQVYFDIFEELN